MNTEGAAEILATGKRLAPDRFPQPSPETAEVWAVALSEVDFPRALWGEAVILWATKLVGDRMVTPRDLIGAAYSVRDRWEGDPEKAAALARAGFEQLVLPRELSLEETAAVRRAVPSGTELEAFVHGALCVSYSGDCQAGFVAMGRSANRGECPQMCRLQYSLTDREGRELAPPAHYLSLRDLNRLDTLGKMAAAGADIFLVGHPGAHPVQAENRILPDQIQGCHIPQFRNHFSHSSFRIAITVLSVIP